MIFDNTTIRPNFTIGGKATGLYKLQQAGVSVPPFLVIPAECFDPVLEPYPATEQALALRKLALSTFRLSAEDQAIITETLTAWGFPKQAVVVRSSIADEDGTAHTFAGLMDSCLNLTSHESMYEAIGQCAASAYSDRAIAYRKHKGLALNARPAVIIQQQITPLASGVLFTTFPDYPQEMAVHATFGFGEGLMQGSVEADEFYWLKESGKLHRTKIATKVQQLVTAQGEGIQSVPIPPQQQAVPCLTPDQLSGLFQLGSMLEKVYQQPQDVEFVVTDKALFIVQSRPITQPIPEIIVYDNSNIQESYCGVTTPLTFSFASRAYATVYRQTMQTLGLPKSAILEQETVITNLLGLVKGRIYYNINNWYRGLQLLPSFRQNKADMERMMGLEEPVDFVKDREKTIGEKARMLPGLLLNLGRLLWAFSGLSKKIPTFHAHFRKHYHRFYQQILSELAYYELLQQKKELDNELLGNWATPIINDFYVMMTNGSVVRKLKKAGIQSPEEFLSRYLSGDKQIESTQPVKAMQQLAAQANEQQTLRQLISEFPENLHQKVGNEYPDFHKLVTEFIDQYGDRTVGELKLETITMRLSPMVFYQYLRNYLSAPNVAESLMSPTMSLQAEATIQLNQVLSDKNPFFSRQVRSSLAKLQQAIRFRESLRLERTRLFGMYRALYLALGEKLVQSHCLKNQTDIFYLTEDEIINAVNQPKTIDLLNLVAARRMEFNQYEKEDVPSRVVVPSPPVVAQIAGTMQVNQLQGTGCVPGVISGEVIVIKDPRDSLAVSGKIVCALRTDPGWAVLFPTCRAVLIEKGSSLSHSVILLRELGIPTIINVPDLTKTIQTGQFISLNGASGTINILTNEHD